MKVYFRKHQLMLLHLDTVKNKNLPKTCLYNNEKKFIINSSGDSFF